MPEQTDSFLAGTITKRMIDQSVKQVGEAVTEPSQLTRSAKSSLAFPSSPARTMQPTVALHWSALRRGVIFEGPNMDTVTYWTSDGRRHDVPTEPLLVPDNVSLGPPH